VETVREDVALPGVTEGTGAGPGAFDLGLAWHVTEVPGVGEVTMHSGGTLVLTVCD
jgi:hypothetical protein